MIMPVNMIEVLATETNTDSVPVCDCDNTSEDLMAHSDSQCSLKAYCMTVAAENTAEELYAQWDEFPENAQSFILTYLSWNGSWAEKLAKLKELITGFGESESVDNTASDGTKVTVSGNLPEGAGVEIGSVDDAELINALDNPDYVYDIKLTSNGSACQPDGQVTVELDLEVPEDKGIIVYHILENETAIKEAVENETAGIMEDEQAVALFPTAMQAAFKATGIEDIVCIEMFSSENGSAKINANSICFDVNSFSTFVIYTVDFHYNDVTFSIPGGSGILLSELFVQLGIEKNIADVENVTFTDESLVSVEEQDSGDWKLTSLQAFSTTEMLTIELIDGEKIEIVVTDAAMGVQTTNDQVLLSQSGTEKTYQIFGKLYPNVTGVYTSFATTLFGVEVTLELYESNGTHVASSWIDQAFSGVQFNLGGNYWYQVYDTYRCQVSEKGDNNFTFDTTNILTGRKVYIRRYPLTTYNNSSYCTVNQKSVMSEGTTTRTVKVYANGNYVGEWSGLFPDRNSMAASDLTVTNVKSPYVASLTKVSIESGYYRVDLYTQNKATATSGTGISSTSGSGTYKYGTSVTFDATVRDGYTWDGWYNSAGTKVSSSKRYSFTIGTSDVSLTAKAIGNKNTATASKGTGISATSGTGTYSYESNVTFGATVSPGYTWSGWYDGSALKSSNQTYTFSMPNSAVTYTAKATANTYKVHFDANTGTGTMSDQNFTYDAKQKLTANTFTKTGHTFTGWNTKADGTGTAYNNQQEVSNLATSGTVTLYAQWDISTHTATANAGTGVPATMGTGEYEYNESVTFIATVIPGYHFDGWYDSNNNKVSSSGTFTFTMPDDDVTYTAKATANAYTVHFDANTGTGTMSDQDFTYGVKQKLTANAFEKMGYSFTGWNTNAEGTGTSYSDKQEVSNLTMTNNGTVTLYAQWDINTHTATAEKLDGIATVSGGGEYDYNSSVTFTATLESGYQFDGWYDSEGNKVSDSETFTFTMPDDDVTYTAKATRVEAEYVVKHMIKDYGKTGYVQYGESVEMEGYAGDETQAATIEIKGYTAREPIEQKTISADGTTVVEIYYDENEVVVTYLPNNQSYGSVDPTEEKVGEITGTINGSVPTANKGFEFVGWYTDVDCKNAVSSNLVDDETDKFTPAKVDGLNESATYYAKFEAVESTIKVIMNVDGKMADKTKEFTGNVNYSVFTSQDVAQVSFDLVDNEGSETINVSAGNKVWLSNLLKDQQYTLEKIVFNDVEVEEDSEQTLKEGANIFYIYYTSKDIPVTGISSGHSGAVVAVLTVALFFVGTLFVGRLRRRREVW